LLITVSFALLKFQAAAKVERVQARSSSVAKGNPESEPVRYASRFVTVDGTRLHYIMQGTGQPVVLIHGNPGSAQDWLPVLNLLAARHKVIAFDRLGHGHSDRPKHGDATVEVQAQLIHGALAQLHVERPIVVGHSWAAALALDYAMSYPKEVAGILVVAPAVYEDNDDGSFLTGMTTVPVIGDAANFMLTPLLAPSVIRSELKKAFSPDAVPDAYLRAALAEWSKPSHVRAYAVDVETFNPSLRKLTPHYSEIQAPLSILAGDSDLVVSGKENAVRLHDELPKSRLIVLPRTGHEIPYTRPKAVVSEIERLQRLSHSSFWGFAG
jgi:pimeloyl-ACP methyl ester carboxylesterase